MSIGSWRESGRHPSLRTKKRREDHDSKYLTGFGIMSSTTLPTYPGVLEFEFVSRDAKSGLNSKAESKRAKLGFRSSDAIIHLQTLPAAGANGSYPLKLQVTEKALRLP